MLTDKRSQAQPTDSNSGLCKFHVDIDGKKANEIRRRSLFVIVHVCFVLIVGSMLHVGMIEKNSNQ